MIDESTVDLMRAEAVLGFERGSTLFETPTMYSDRDILYVIPNWYSGFLYNCEKGIFEHTFSSDGIKIDEQFICESDFQKLIDSYDVAAIETMFTPDEHILFYHNEKHNLYVQFPLNKWKIRQSFSATASNSWAKAHKKMTVEKDLDMYRGAKSLFHSLRILMFANQICEHGKIVNFKEANGYWWDIYNAFLDGKKWDYFKEKYRPVYNELRSKLAILAPKPIDNEKQK